MLPQLICARKPSTKQHIAFIFSRALRFKFSTHTINTAKQNDQLPPRPTLPDEVLTKKFLKGSGPGGQKINKTSSAVQLTHVPTGIVVKSQATRSRMQNEHIAKRILAEKIEFLEKGSESRVEKKRERASRKKRSAEKKSRRKYRRLEEAAGQNQEALALRSGEEFLEDEDEDGGNDDDDVEENEEQEGNAQHGTVVVENSVRHVDTMATNSSKRKPELG